MIRKRIALLAAAVILLAAGALIGAHVALTKSTYPRGRGGAWWE